MKPPIPQYIAHVEIPKGNKTIWIIASIVVVAIVLYFVYKKYKENAA